LHDADVHFGVAWVARVRPAKRLRRFQVFLLPYRNVKRGHVHVDVVLAKLSQQPKELARPLQRIVRLDEFQPLWIVVLGRGCFESLVFVLFRPHLL